MLAKILLISYFLIFKTGYRNKCFSFYYMYLIIYLLYIHATVSYGAYRTTHTNRVLSLYFNGSLGSNKGKEA